MKILEEMQFLARWYRVRLRVRVEKLIMAVIWRLPRRAIYFAVIRVWSHGTTGQFEGTHPDDLGWGEALRRWEQDSERLEQEVRHE